MAAAATSTMTTELKWTTEELKAFSTRYVSGEIGAGLHALCERYYGHKNWEKEVDNLAELLLKTSKRADIDSKMVSACIRKYYATLIDVATELEYRARYEKKLGWMAPEESAARKATCKLQAFPQVGLWIMDKLHV